jgi:hypothetical protein
MPVGECEHLRAEAIAKLLFELVSSATVEYGFQAGDP